MSNIPDNIKKMWEQAANLKEGMTPMEGEKSRSPLPSSRMEREPVKPSPRAAYAAKHGKGGTGHDLETENPALYKKNLDLHKG